MTKHAIYFIKCGGFIKVGYSKNIPERLRTLQTASSQPLELYASIPGSIELERAIHAYLDFYRAHGEWFQDCRPVRGAISQLMLIGGDAIGFKQQPVAKKSKDRSSDAAIEPLPMLSDETLAAVNAALVEAKNLADEIYVKSLAREDVSSKLPRLNALAKFIGSTLYPARIAA